MEASSSGASTGMDPKRIVGFSYIAFGLIGVLFFKHLVAGIFSLLRVGDPMLLGVEQLSPSSLVGGAIAIGIALACYFNKRVYEGSLHIANELNRVTWPSLAETKVSTIAVIVVSVIASLILFFFDFISAKVMSQWIPSLLTWIAGL